MGKFSLEFATQNNPTLPHIYPKPDFRHNLHLTLIKDIPPKYAPCDTIGEVAQVIYGRTNELRPACLESYQGKQENKGLKDDVHLYLRLFSMHLNVGLFPFRHVSEVLNDSTVLVKNLEYHLTSSIQELIYNGVLPTPHRICASDVYLAKYSNSLLNYLYDFRKDVRKYMASLGYAEILFAPGDEASENKQIL